MRGVVDLVSALTRQGLKGFKLVRMLSTLVLASAEGGTHEHEGRASGRWLGHWGDRVSRSEARLRGRDKLRRERS